jgi:hypothetical protein
MDKEQVRFKKYIMNVSSTQVGLCIIMITSKRQETIGGDICAWLDVTWIQLKSCASDAEDDEHIQPLADEAKGITVSTEAYAALT